MANVFDLETNVETAISGLLTDEGLNVIRWSDIENAELSLITKINAREVNEEEGTVNTYAASRIVVDIVSFESKRRDEKGTISNNARGMVREAFYSSHLSGSPESRLSGYLSGVYYYDNGIYPIGSFDASDSKNWGRGVSFMVVCKPNHLSG